MIRRLLSFTIILLGVIYSYAFAESPVAAPSQAKYIIGDAELSLLNDVQESDAAFIGRLTNCTPLKDYKLCDECEVHSGVMVDASIKCRWKNAAEHIKQWRLFIRTNGTEDMCSHFASHEEGTSHFVTARIATPTHEKERILYSEKEMVRPAKSFNDAYKILRTGNRYQYSKQTLTNSTKATLADGRVVNIFAHERRTPCNFD